MFKKYALITLMVFAVLGMNSLIALPMVYDLRHVDSTTSYISLVRDQQGGTCWTHGTMAAVESNMLRNGLWPLSNLHELNLSEYHLDWWNGFNLYYNEDFGFHPVAGLDVHFGGDYRVSTAYMSRGDGAVLHSDAPAYESVYPRRQTHYTYYYPRHVEWYVLKNDMSNLNDLKQVIMDQGAVGTCMYVGSGFLNDSTGIHYQPASDQNDPNHSIAIVGWNDTLTTQADLPGAWLCKNSWGESWGSAWHGSGYFWISYYDKHTARQEQMGFVSFQDVEEMKYDTVYYHDYHGWRDELADVDEVANIFKAEGNDTLKAVNFFTAADSVNCIIRVYMGVQKAYENNPELIQSKFYAHTGLHTLDLENAIQLTKNDTFVVSVEFDNKLYPYDKTSEVPVLLDVPSIYNMAPQNTMVPSKASMRESMFKVYGQWLDLQYLDQSANFCVKALIDRSKTPSALTQNPVSNSFSLYPNPSPGRIHIDFELPASSEIKITLYDLSGRRLKVLENAHYSMGYNVKIFDFSDLSNGIYVCTFEMNGIMMNIQKLMVVK